MVNGLWLMAYNRYNCYNLYNRYNNYKINKN